MRSFSAGGNGVADVTFTREKSRSFVFFIVGKRVLCGQMYDAGAPVSK